MDIDRQKKFIVQFAFWLLVGGVVYVLLKYVMPLLTPFIIGFLVAIMFRPLSAWLSKITRLNQKIVALLILMLFYAAMSTVLILSGVKIANIIGEFVATIPVYFSSTVAPAFGRLFDDMLLLISDLDPSLQNTLQNMAGNLASSLGSSVTSFSTTALNWLRGFAGALPMYMVNLVIALISSFLVSADYPGIKAFILHQLKPRQHEILRMVRDNAKNVVADYLKAYIKLMSITFLELLVGLSVIGANNAGVLALVIAVFDILPVVGTGWVIMPWAVIELLNGSLSQAVKLIILYVVIAAVRNYLEPKIVGEQIGLHPLVTLLCMYVGASLFGVVGMLGLPITATIIKKLNENGTVRLYKL